MLLEAFEHSGFVRIDGAVTREMSNDVRGRMEGALPAHLSGSTAKLGDDAKGRLLMLTPPLRAAFDDLLGPNGWVEPEALEDLRLKRPASREPWWHVDVFERGSTTVDGDVLSWRASPDCGGVGLLVLLLLSDVGPEDGATALRTGSHRVVRQHLEAAGAGGLSLGELLARGIDKETADAPVSLTTGPAGTAYLCHPMLVHSALAHAGAEPSYWALPTIRRVSGSSFRRQEAG